MALYCVCVVPKQYTIPSLPCSVYDLLVVFCVSCTVKALYKCPRPPPSELWYKRLVQYVLLFHEKKKKKKSESGGGGGWKMRGRDCKARTPQQPLNPPHLDPLGFLNIIILTFFI